MTNEQSLHAAPGIEDIPAALPPTDNDIEQPVLPQMHTGSLILNADAVDAPAVAEALLDYLTSPGSAESTLTELPIP